MLGGQRRLIHARKKTRNCSWLWQRFICGRHVWYGEGTGRKMYGILSTLKCRYGFRQLWACNKLWHPDEDWKWTNHTFQKIHNWRWKYLRHPEHINLIVICQHLDRLPNRDVLHPGHRICPIRQWFYMSWYGITICGLFSARQSMNLNLKLPRQTDRSSASSSFLQGLLHHPKKSQ